MVAMKEGNKKGTEGLFFYQLEIIERCKRGGQSLFKAHCSSQLLTLGRFELKFQGYELLKVSQRDNANQALVFHYH
jgi:hypothetical protein